MRRRITLLLVALSSVLMAPCAASGSPGDGGVVINEVLYDPHGADSGREFVELMNLGSQAICLDGWSLRAGDGSRENCWRSVWHGLPGDTIQAGGLFLVAESEIVLAGAHAELGLQNGPDGCALMLDESPADVVGWGAHEFSEYYEGAPAPAAASGASLARRPDGHDTDVNSADFAPGFPPTPGRPNTPARDLAFSGAGVEVDPPNPEAYERVSVAARVINAGYGPGRVDEFTLLLEATDAEASPSSIISHITSTMSPGDSAEFRYEWYPPSDGPFRIAGTIEFDGDQVEEGNARSVAVRVGPGPLVVSEIMYDPLAGGEWLELLNAASHPVDLNGWRIADMSGEALEIASHPFVQPGGYVVVAQDSAAIAATYPAMDASGAVGSYRGRWPALNNSDGPGGIAERVTLIDPNGMPSDVIAYSERLGGGDGVSLERLRPDLVGHRLDNWFSSVAPAGATPGGDNSAGGKGPAGNGMLSVDPVFVGSGGAVAPARISYDLPFRPSRLRLSIYSMDGREVALLADRENGPARGSLLWNGVEGAGGRLAAGAYIVLLVGWGDSGENARAKAVVVVR